MIACSPLCELELEILMLLKLLNIWTSKIILRGDMTLSLPLLFQGEFLISGILGMMINFSSVFYFGIFFVFVAKWLNKLVEYT